MKNRLRSSLVCIGALALAASFSLFISCTDVGPQTPHTGIVTPRNGSVITNTGLVQIRGWFEENSYYGDVDEVKVTISRFSDGKFWNGSAWEGGETVLTPTTIDHGTETWELNIGLPSGSDPETGLPEGSYAITAAVVYAPGPGDTDTSVGIFTVGASAPPIKPTLYSWGKNDRGQLGTAAPIPQSYQPVLVFAQGAMDGKVIGKLATGFFHSVVQTDGGLFSWGYDAEGQLGQGTHPGTNIPQPANVYSNDFGGQTIEAISAGLDHTLAVTADGAVFAWGSNQEGQIGNGNTGGLNYFVPQAVSGALAGKRVVAVEASRERSVALTSDGQVFTWGLNLAFEPYVGGEPMYHFEPVLVQGALASKFVTAIAAGGYFTLALTSDGEVYGIGPGGYLGNGEGQPQAKVPVRCGATSDMATKRIVAIGAGDDHALALDEDGVLYGWGSNDDGQCAAGAATEMVYVPIAIGGELAGKRVTRMFVGLDSNFAITDASEIFGWGNNRGGVLTNQFPTGDFNIYAEVHTPTLITTLSNALSNDRVLYDMVLSRDHVLMLTGFPPWAAPEIEVEAQGDALVDGVSSNQILFDQQAIGTPSPIWVTVRNTGTSYLSDFDALIDGADAGDFYCTFYQPPLAPSGTTGFYVFFNPTASGTRSATLHIYSNDADENPFDINIVGTSYPAAEPENGFTAGPVGTFIATTVMQPDGKILLGGSFTTLQPKGSASPAACKNIGRLNPDGTLDASFRPDADDWVRCIALQQDGKILIGGQFSTLQPGGTGTVHTRNCLARLESDGTVDTSFVANLDGLVRCILPLSNGQILIGGQFTTVNNGSGPATRNRIALLNPDGTPDPSFDPNANGEVLTMVEDGWGRIYVAGYFTSIGGASRLNVARLNLTDGTADDWVTMQNAWVFALAMDRDGAVLIGGDFSKSLPGGGTVTSLIRVMSNGDIDEFWRPNPIGRVNAISLETGSNGQTGRILVSGNFTTVQPHPDESPTDRHRMARFHPNGTLDYSFDPDFDGEVFGAAIQADGKIVPAGAFTTVGGQPCVGIARLSNSTVTDVLGVPSLSYIHWERGGALPESREAWFDLSTNGGSTWTPLSGTVSRSITGWEMTGVSLPSTGRIRARARIASGHHNGSSGIVEKQVIYSDVPAIAVYKDGILQIHSDSHQFGVVQTGSGAVIKVFTVQNAGGGVLTGFANAVIEDELFELGDDATNFRLTPPPVSSLATGESTTLAVRYQPKTTGDHYALLRIPSNDYNQPEFFVLLKGTGSLPIATWRQQNFGDTANTGEAADTATNEAGITRLEAYALGLDPHTATSEGTSISVGGGGGGGGSFASENDGKTANDGSLAGGVFYFDYQRSKLALAEVIFQVEWTDTLQENDWHIDDVTEEILGDDGSIQQVRASVPVGSAGRRFARLRITRP